MIKTPITVAYGDGIGPEIVSSTLAIMQEAGASLDIEMIEVGEKVYLLHGVGIAEEGWESLKRTQLFLKGPITTPQGGGYKSLNVATRKRLGLYANIRPCVAYAPFIRTQHPTMDLVIIRENEEDVYTGIEYRQSADVRQCLKIVTEQGCERIIRYAFEYAKAHGRRKITCFSKDNIMKLTDGLFHKVFDTISKEYPDLEKEHLIVDIGAARIATQPELFDVVVMQNLYGDIISDITAEMTGSVGLVGTANIGQNCAMFEAIHGSAPSIASQDIANPSACILASVMMLVHIGQHSIAQTIHNAWLATIEKGIHTPDIYLETISKQKVGTQAFTKAIIQHLGTTPCILKPVEYRSSAKKIQQSVASIQARPIKQLVGVDVFIDYPQGTVQKLAKSLEGAGGFSLKLDTITNRGAEVWPEKSEEIMCVDQYRCRFLSANKQSLSSQDIIDLLLGLQKISLDCVKTESLYTFDGQCGYSKDD